MSTRVFSDPRPTITLADGVTPNALGQLFFYEPGEGSTVPKDIYFKRPFSDTTKLNNQPYTLNASGKPTEDILLDGDYRIVFKDQYGVEYDEVISYQSDQVLEQFGAWNAALPYAVNDFVRGTDGNYYQSIGSENKGNDPVTTDTKWEQKVFLGLWSAYKPYKKDIIVQHEGDQWVSLSDDNLGNTPTASSPSWRSFFKPSVVTDYVASSFEYRHADGPQSPSFDVYADLTPSTWESLGPTGSGATHEWAALDQVPDAATSVMLKITYGATRDLSPDGFILIEASARIGGGSATAGVDFVSDSDYGGTTSGSFGRIQGSPEGSVVLGPNKTIDLKYRLGGDDSEQLIVMYLAGYKI